MLITPTDAPMLADEYIADGLTVGDWLHDNAIQCEDCDRHYTSRADFVDPDRGRNRRPDWRGARPLHGQRHDRRCVHPPRPPLHRHRDRAPLVRHCLRHRDAMKAHIYLTITKSGVVKLTQAAPSLGPRQRAIRLQVTVADAAFAEPAVLDAQLDIPTDALAYPPAHTVEVEIWKP